jgi:CheY-like chemotaxis protein
VRPAAAPPPCPTVLVVDDEWILRELLRASLGPGYTFVDAEDGERALELARSERPDLIVLDLMLPRRSGLEVIAELRADFALADVAILVLTAQPSLLDEARAQGADAAMAKPFEPDTVALVAGALLSRRAAARRAA